MSALPWEVRRAPTSAPWAKELLGEADAANLKGMQRPLTVAWRPAVLAMACALGCTRLGYDLLDANELAGGGSGSLGSGGAGGGAPGAGGDAGSGDASAANGAGGTAAAGGTSGTAGSGGGTVGSAPPLAAFSVAPSVGDTTTVFSADASASSDAEQPTSELAFEWDWESDGTFDDSGVTATHTYGSVGTYTVTVRVSDADGGSDTESAEVSVVAAGDLLVVTTAADEENVGATQADPLGTGLSLREAINLSNALAGRQTIFVPSDDIPLIELVSVMDQLQDGADVFGYGVVVDGSTTPGNSDCLVINGSDVRLLGFEIHGCPNRAIAILGGDGSQVADCHLHDNGGGVFTTSGSSNTIGPGNLLVNHGDFGVFANGPSSVVGNTIRDAVNACIQIGGGAPGSVVRGNLCVRIGTGITISTNADDVVLANNTVDSSSGNGIVAAGVSNLLLYNNSVTNSAVWGYIASDAALGGSASNLSFGNASGDCNGCDLGPGSLTEDPLYLDPASDDFRPAADSPLIDAGFDVGEPFNGSAPDIGYYETL